MSKPRAPRPVRFYFTVVEIETGLEVYRVDVTRHGPSARDKVERALVRRIDSERFFVGEASG